MDKLVEHQRGSGGVLHRHGSPKRSPPLGEGECWIISPRRVAPLLCLTVKATIRGALCSLGMGWITAMLERNGDTVSLSPVLSYGYLLRMAAI